jgi:DNA polymerase-1
MKKKTKPKNRLLIFDGSNCMARAFFAVPQMTTSKGFHTNAIKGTINIVTSVVRDARPTHIALTMDRKYPTHRHNIFADYKGNRVRDPEEQKRLVPQRKPLYDLLRAMGIRVVHKAGVEADDLVGTLARKAAKKGWEVIIVSNDKDFGQLLDDPLIIQWKYIDKTVGYRRVTHENCEEVYGVPASRVIDKLMMEGDKVDNIPGVKGIGLAAIRKLIATHKRIEKADLSVLNKTQRATFEASRKQLKLTRELVTINCDIIPISLRGLKPTEPDIREISRICKALEAQQIRHTVMNYVDQWVSQNHI